MGQEGTMKNDDVNTVELLARVRAGDSDARNRLLEHALPPLLRFARGRLPSCIRAATDTRDLVHDVILRALPRLESFRAEAPGALQAFLRRAVANQIVDEIRRARNRQGSSDPLERLHDRKPSALAELMARQDRDRLRAAFATLSRSDRALLIARFHVERRYADVARVHNKPTANAARAAVDRAVARLAKALNHQSKPPSVH
jgi:RNA polymerase sigma factor (sigma-70 family)